ncbi:unnamed protein product [Phytophthora fragariaefolia]|uniref:Unnamed protein product n=1 Tax=Phytophthora fragariaefolia TaxID=1490495 RepID=A0A9W6U5D8_9STRA|nr:unnamed protein product [Phytophthora fragariaefolia]
MERLRNLHARRPVFKEAVVDHPPIVKEVAWPLEIEFINECIVPEGTGISFHDTGNLGKCKCFGDCFMDSCENATCAIYCTPECCKLGAVCSNAPRERTTLKLFDTGRVGLGVYTTTFLDVGDIIGEYAGKLCEYSALIPGQPNQAKKQNSGYTLLYNTKSVRNKFVYVESLDCGFTTSFISHACDPNAAFVEVHNRTSVQVLVRMIKDVKAGSQITVDYGNERWFTCACDDCWGKKKKK